MAELQIFSVHCFGPSYGVSGKADVRFGEIKMELELSPDDTAQVLAITMAAAQREQARLADEIRTAQPALLCAPTDWEEV